MNDIFAILCMAWFVKFSSDALLDHDMMLYLISFATDSF